jgi:hypothetical protein
MQRSKQKADLLNMLIYICALCLKSICKQEKMRLQRLGEQPPKGFANWRHDTSHFRGTLQMKRECFISSHQWQALKPAGVSYHQYLP